MSGLGKVRQALALILVAIGVLTFFLPIIGITAPIVGKMQWSPLNVVSQLSGDHQSSSPSLSRVTGRLSKMNGEAKPSALTRPQNTPLGITLAPFIPLEITLAYMLLLCATVVLFVPPIQRIVGAIAVLGTASSAAALISVFLLSDAIQQIFAVEMNSPEMQNNPFAGFGKALMQSIRIEPGLALYLLVAVMLSLVVVYRFSALDRVTIAEEKSVATDAGE